MAFYLLVSKVLILKILLISVAVCVCYEYGYHPSAEEFDNLMRETRKTWTGDLLANERRRATTWTYPTTSMNRHHETPANSFFPKYNYEKEHNRYEMPAHLNWPKPVSDPAEAVVNVPPMLNDRFDQPSAPSLLAAAPSNIASTLDFTMFSDEVQLSEPSVEQTQLVPENNLFSSVFISSGSTTKPQSSSSPLKSKKEPLRTTTKLPEIFKIPSVFPEYSDNENDTISTPPIFYNNNSVSQLPIFFTNPATGIVYAITEVGKVQDNVTLSNDSIPIYITKQQYDRDLFLQRKFYEHRCWAQQNTTNKSPTINYSSNTSAISTPFSTTMRPQIIRLQKPATPNILSKLPTAKVPILPNKPSPVLVQSSINIVESSSPTPTRKKRPKVPKRKKKKAKKRPGRKSPSSRSTAKTTPEIVVGKRPTEQSRADIERLSTQLEKPEATIFSDRPLVSIKRTIEPKPIHRIRRSAATNSRARNSKFLDHNFNATIELAENLNMWQPVVQQNNTLARALDDGEARGTKKVTRPTRPVREIVATSTKLVNIPNQNTIKTVRKKQSKKSTTTTTKAPYAKVTFVQQTTTPKVEVASAKPATAVKASKRTRTKAAKKRRKSQRKAEAADDYNYFGLFGNNEDEDDEDDDDDDDADDDDASEHDDEYDEANSQAPQHDDDDDDDDDVFYPNDKMPIDNNDAYPQYNTETITDLKTEHSSIEQLPDYGTLYVSSEHIASPSTEDISTSSSENIKSNKKRTRRRPSSYRQPDYYDDDDVDDVGGSGLNGFLRMLFYPVQLVMDRLFDSYAGNAEKDISTSSSEEDVAAIPAYTMYNNLAAYKGDDIMAEEEQQANSLTDWFSSWFGFNRRTKKIGSTTASPLALPTTTEEPGWLDSWFNYGSSKTTTEASFEDYDDDYSNKWFFGWFDSKPKKTKRKRDTTTTTTTSLPQVPILTIVDPMRNPQNWIGILAHHIINSTATSTHSPLLETYTRATTTTTTTASPDIPRKITYEKHQIWRLKPQDDIQVRALEEYKRSDDGVKLQWLKGPSLRGLNDVLVSPRMFVDFQATLSFESIAHEVLVFDVGKAIAYEKSKEQYFYTTTHRPNKHHKNAPLTMSWNNYYEYDDIIKYLESLRMRHPQMIELIHIGRSYEGRPLIIVKIESKPVAAASAAATANRKKLKYKKKSGLANAVFIEAGTHGMEWIGPATSTWMINELLRLMKNNKTSIEQEFIKKTTWYILPVLNPDGYVYTHEYDRFWKKTRSRHISRPGGLITSAMTWLQQGKTPERVCYGVDLDRNWNYQWGRRGSSKSPCNEFFAGPVPFSEPETKALSEFLLDYRKQIKLYISLQAYGQVVSYPYRPNSSYNTDKMDDFLDVALVSTDGLRKKSSKSRYKIDSTSDLMAKRSGCSDAFAAYEVGIPFSYTLQLADNGVHGYLLPSSSIESTARDAFEIITAMVDYI